MKHLATIISLTLIALGSFVATAAAAGAVAPETSHVLDLARSVFDAVMSGSYWYAAALALVLAVAAGSKYGGKYWKFLGSGPGKAALVLVGSFAGAFATTLAAGASPSAAMAWMAIQVALGAAGGYSLVKSLVLPLLQKAAARWPWLKFLAKPLEWITGRDPAEEARAAGDAAVAENPPTGIAGIVGEPKDIP